MGGQSFGWGILCLACLLLAAHAQGQPRERTEGANVLILHPIYAGSHELTLRKFGEKLVERGHRVTQLRWRSTKTRAVNSSVQVITLNPDNHDLRQRGEQMAGIILLSLSPNNTTSSMCAGNGLRCTNSGPK
ncbi:uncharacterized protein LOC134767479 [Penaeus indicus]|uniref:uncharacterized protein LOC134767479 n=1 Tax=Penaeus indicus TaxID=29960 RepID=UPI00300D8D04